MVNIILLFVRFVELVRMQVLRTICVSFECDARYDRKHARIHTVDEMVL